MIWFVVALFVLYAVAVTWQMRRALAQAEGAPRLREARRLLILVSLGVPLVAVLILVAL